MKTAVTAAVILFLCALLPLPLPAGGRREQPAEPERPGAETPESAEPAGLTELTVWAGLPTALRMNMKDLNEHPVIQEMERRTGVRVNWIHPPRGAFDENFNLMIASRDWPDVFKAGLEKAGGAQSLHEDGVIMELTGLMPDHAPNLWRILKDNPATMGEYMTSGGRFFGVKMLTLDKKMNVVTGPQIRKDWLIKLGLDVPETLNEFRAVLTAFRDRDPNGNGLADEIPLSGVGLMDTTYAVGKFTVWPFGTDPEDFYMAGDTVTYGPLTPELKEAMEYTRELYTEGLIDPDYLLNDRGKMDGKMAQNRVGMVYSWQPVKYMDSIPKKIPDFYITGIPFLRKDGDSPNYCFETRFLTTVTQTEAVITTAAEFPEQTLEWLDYPFSDEGHLLFNFGIEGESYEMTGGLPRYTEKVLNNPKHSVVVAHQLFHMAQNAWPMVQDPRHIRQLYTHPAVDECKEQWAKGDLSRVYPAGIKFDWETNDIRSQFEIDIKTYVSEFLNKLVIGQAEFDEWEGFQNRLESMGIREVLNIYQEAYDEYADRMESITGNQPG